MIRRTLSVFVLVVVMSVAGSTKAQEPDTNAARVAVDSWLSLIDTANAKSWDEAATFFKSAVSSETWQAAVKTARGPFGALKSRTVKSATPATKLPGAPEGEYVVFNFDAIYEQKPAIEQVTLVREKDGAWRVVGYFVK